MESGGSSNLEKAKQALEKFEHAFEAGPIDEEDKAEAYGIKTLVHSLFSIAESLDEVAKKTSKRRVGLVE